jgi:hypothetical protein
MSYTRLADRLRSSPVVVFPRGISSFKKIEPNSSLPLLLAKATQTALAGSENRPYYVYESNCNLYRERSHGKKTDVTLTKVTSRNSQSGRLYPINIPPFTSSVCPVM